MVPAQHAASALKLIRHCARAMDEEAGYVLDRNDYDRLSEKIADSNDLPTSFVDSMANCRLLIVTDDIVFFEHDLLRDYFVAEDLQRRNLDLGDLRNELARPKYTSVREFVIPRFKSASDVVEVLATAHDGKLLSGGLEGRLGQLTQRTIISRNKFSGYSLLLPKISPIWILSSKSFRGKEQNSQALSILPSSVRDDGAHTTFCSAMSSSTI